MSMTNLTGLNGQLIVKGDALATNCCCRPYVLAVFEVVQGETWNTGAFIGPGIAHSGGDVWRVAEAGWGWLIRGGCIESDGTLNGLGLDVSDNNWEDEAMDLPVGYGGSYELQIGCWSGDEIIWPE